MNIKTSYFYVASSALLFIGTFLPWVSFLGLTANGTSSDDGTLVIGLAIIVALAAFMAQDNRRWSRIAVMLSCVAALAIAIYHLVDIMSYSAADNTLLSNVRPEMGFGLWVILLGACIGLVGSVRVYLHPQPRPLVINDELLEAYQDRMRKLYNNN